MSRQHTELGKRMKAIGAVSDPATALLEIAERDALTRTRTATGAPVAGAREAFMSKNAGFWVVVFANEQFVNKYDSASMLLVRFFREHARAADFVRRMALDADVKLVPCIVPANHPTLIPFSEASALDARHTLEKVARLGQRVEEYHRYRAEEFKSYVRTHQPGERTASDYTRAKMRLLKQRVSEIRARAASGVADPAGRDSTILSDAECARIDAILKMPLPRHDFETLRPGRCADASADADADASRSAPLKVVDHPEFGKIVQYDRAAVPHASREETGAEALRRMVLSAEEPADVGVPDDVDAAAAAAVDVSALPDFGMVMPSTKAAADAAANAAAGAGTDAAAASVPAADLVEESWGSLAAPPPPILDAAVPEHWRVREGVMDDAWPMRWTDKAAFAIISIIDDYDLESDDPAFASAAGKEPMIILWGGEYDDEAAAKRVLNEQLAPWCEDLTFDVVSKHRLLVPACYDPDQVEEKGRTGTAEFTQTWNAILESNKVEKRQLEYLRNSNLVVPEIPVNTAATAPATGMQLVGAVQQFDENHMLINQEEVMRTLYTSALPDLDL